MTFSFRDPDHRQTQTMRQRLFYWCAWFFVCNIAILLLLSLRYLDNIEIPVGGPAIAFSITAFIGHFFSASLLCFLIVVPFVLLFPNRAVIFTLAILMASALLAYITIDTFIFSLYHYHFNSMVLNLLSGGAANQIFNFSATLWSITAGLVAAIIAGELLLTRIVWLRVCKNPRIKILSRIVLLLLGVFTAENAAYALASSQAYTPVTQQIHNLPGYRPLTLHSPTLHSDNAQTQLKQMPESGTLQYPLNPLQCDKKINNPNNSLNNPPNIVMLVIDSWRYDMLDPIITPRLHSFAQQAWQFSQHYSGGNSTRIGLFSLFYGIPGNYWHSMREEQRGAELIRQLQQQDYQTGIFASASLKSPEFHQTVFADIKDLPLHAAGNTPAERDQDTARSVTGFIEQASTVDSPFFAFAFFDAAHAYDYPGDYPRPFQPDWPAVNFLALDNDFDPAQFINRYKNALHFVDSLSGQVLDTLKQQGLLNNTIVVVTSDHGQEFNDTRQNYWGHTSNFSPYQTRVPLIVHWPGQGAKFQTQRSSHADIAPTLMSRALGCKNPFSDYSNGQDLLTATAERPLLINNYYHYAVDYHDRLFVVDEYSNVTVRDRLNYARLIDAPALPAQVATQITNDLNRFYR